MLYEMSGSSRSLLPYVNGSASGANIWVFLNNANFRTTGTVIAGVKESLQQGLPAGWQVKIAGNAYLSHVLVAEITRSQLVSLALSVALVLLVTWLTFRAAVITLIVMLPVSLAVLWNFGFMGAIGMPLGVATSTFSSIALGIGVDSAIHWMSRLRHALDEGAAFDAARRLAAVSAGSSILVNNLVLLCGFGVLLVSAAPPTRRLGLLLCLNLIVCLAGTIVVLPAVCTLARNIFAARNNAAATRHDSPTSLPPA